MVQRNTSTKPLFRQKSKGSDDSGVGLSGLLIPPLLVALGQTTQDRGEEYCTWYTLGPKLVWGKGSYYPAEPHQTEAEYGSGLLETSSMLMSVAATMYRRRKDRSGTVSRTKQTRSLDQPQVYVRYTLINPCVLATWSRHENPYYNNNILQWLFYPTKFY